MPTQNTKREATGKWQPGYCPNPGGRPTKMQNVIRQKIADGADNFLNVLFEAANGGDLYAARTLLDRICSPLKVTTIEQPTQTFELIKAISAELKSINERLARLEAK